MNNRQFNELVYKLLATTGKKVVYCKIENGIYVGGICSSFKEALEILHNYYQKNINCELCIADYGSNTTKYGLKTTIWQNKDILTELRIV